MEQKQPRRTALDFERLEKWEKFYKEQQHKLQEATRKVDDPQVKLHLSDLSDMILPLLLVVHPWHSGQETWTAYWHATVLRYGLMQLDGETPTLAKGVSELTHENLKILGNCLVSTLAERIETSFERVVYNPF